MHHIKHHQRGEQAIAGGGFGRKEDVAGLLAAQRGTGFLHEFENVLIPDRSAQHTDARAAKRCFKAHVAHGGGNHRVGGKLTAGVKVAGTGKHDGVAVDHAAVLVGEEGTVGIAVKGEAHHGAAGFDLGGNDVRVKRAAVLIDIATIRGGMGDLDGAVEAGKKFRSESRGSAIGTIDHDTAVVE